jgi:iron donor protein CyaY
MESEVFPFESFTLVLLPCGSRSIVSSEYNRAMDEQDFRRRADASLESLKRSLYEAEGEADFEVEENAGALHIAFEEPPGRFVISPNAPVRQIWISALSTSFKLDWSEQSNDFALSKTGETIKQLVGRLINEQLGEQAIRLN